MGDMLIAASTILFFDKYRLPYTLKRDASRMDVVVYGGGGIWLGMYKKVWKKLLPTFRNAKRVIILPSSFFDCDELLEELDERFVVFCRELQSYNYLLNAKTKAKVILDHDMAFRMPREILGIRTKPSFRVLNKARKACEALMSMNSNIGHFFRRDVESLHHIDKGIDLSRFINGRMESSRKHIMFAAQFMLCALDGYDVIITDRLHVGIAGYLMKKEVYLLDNSYKKISSVYHQSLEPERVHLVQEVPEIHDCNHTATKNTALLCEYIRAL